MIDNELQVLMVTNELEAKGFKTMAIGQQIEVSLSDRKVGRIEIEHVLGQEFEGIQFDVRDTWNGVVVRV